MAAASNSRVLRVIPLLIVVCLVSPPAHAKYSGGTGEPNDPYQIATAEDLMLLGETPEDYDRHFILTADIDLDPNLPGRKVFDRAVIAPHVNDVEGWLLGALFAGVFDGNGHRISHLTITGDGHLGLLGRSYGEVKNVGVVNVNINGSGHSVGGLVGSNHGDVSQCYCSGSIVGTSKVGGLAGYNFGSITRSYSTSMVSGGSVVGGLVGQNWGDSYYGPLRGLIARCYSTGAVSGTGLDIGGLVGQNTLHHGSIEGIITGSFWDTQTSGQPASDGGTGQDTGEMHDIQTYQDAGWDFLGEIENGLHEVWIIPKEGGYPALATFNGYTPPELQGMGTMQDPYLISNALELGAMIHYSPYAHYLLAAPLDLSDIRWNTSVIPQLEGTFNGSGLAIKNLHIQGRKYLGLFGQVGSSAKVSNLDLEAVDVNGTGDYVGGIVGHNHGGTLSHCYSTGSVSGNSYVGGLVGWNSGSMTQCYSNSRVTGNGERIGGLVGYNSGKIATSYSTSEVAGNNSYVGGLIGYNERGTVTLCYSTCAVKGTGQYSVGGLVGNNQNSTVSHCYSTGSVCGNSHVGGLVGNNQGDVIRSYSTGAVSGTENVGGLVGTGTLPRVVHSVWNVETSGQLPSDGGVGLTTVEIMDPHMLGLNGFASDPNWVLVPGHDYPRLAWEGTPGSMIPEPDIDWMEGDGTETDPYRIDTADQLILLGRASILWDKHFILGTHIDLDPNLPGRSVFQQALISSFTGVFDGNGHTISGLTSTGGDHLGLFGFLGWWNTPVGEVKNLGVLDFSITGSGSGSLVAVNYGTVTQCYSRGSVIRGVTVGGLIWSNSGSITRSYSTSTVIGIRDIGGLVGISSKDASIANSYSTGLVNGDWKVGGLVGENNGSIDASYSTSTVVGGSYTGGLVGYGYNEQRSITSSFWDIETTGQSTSDGGTGKTTAEMQTASTFLEVGWDFFDETANGTNDIWWILEGQDYPRLWWELIPEN